MEPSAFGVWFQFRQEGFNGPFCPATRENIDSKIFSLFDGKKTFCSDKNTKTVSFLFIFNKLIIQK
jgi:hypothetical protein